MKSKEEIEQLAKIYVESDIKKNPLYGQFHKTYTDGYTQCQEDIKPLLEDLFSLWQSLAEVGEIGIGQKFTKKYEELKNSLNKQD